MGDLINLKKFRKQVERAKAASDAEQNRARFGRTKAQKNLEQQQASRAEQKLDQHLLDDGKSS